MLLVLEETAAVYMGQQRALDPGPPFLVLEPLRARTQLRGAQGVPGGLRPCQDPTLPQTWVPWDTV